MTTRSERYQFEQDASKSRVARNQELYEQLYASDSYFQNDDKPSAIEKTNEIDIEKVKDLLRGREIYRREMKMREINMGNPEKNEEKIETEKEEEKSYDINAYLNKASSERVVEPYHKIDPEILAQPEEPEPVNEDEPSLEELKEMGTTALSLDMFSDLTGTSEIDEVSENEEDEEDETEDPEELVATVTETNAFFTDSIKLELTDDDEDDDDEKSSLVLKIIMVLLILVIIGLVIYLIFM